MFPTIVVIIEMMNNDGIYRHFNGSLDMVLITIEKSVMSPRFWINNLMDGVSIYQDGNCKRIRHRVGRLGGWGIKYLILNMLGLSCLLHTQVHV